MAIRIGYRAVSIKTLPTAIALMKQYYKTDGYRFHTKKARTAVKLLMSKSNLGRIDMIMGNEQPIGYYCVTYGYSLERHGRDAVLDEIYIDQKYRCKGIGEKTIKHIVRELKAAEFKALYLHVRKGNRRAQGFYSQNGFQMIDEAIMMKAIGS